MNTFKILIMIGRPASGKSEIIDHLQHTGLSDRQSKYHIDHMDVLDDFPMLWTWFEEDRILAKKLGKPRLHTDEEGYFKYDYLWHLLIERLSLEYQKRLRDNPTYHDNHTIIIEFSRGSQHGGYSEAFQHLSDEILSQAGVVYVKVPFEESLRKNRRRYNPERPDSILEHALPDEKLERLYKEDDWEEFSRGDEEYLSVRQNRIPYAVFENADDVTTSQPEKLAARLEQVMDRLWDLAHDSRKKMVKN